MSKGKAEELMNLSDLRITSPGDRSFGKRVDYLGMNFIL